MISHVNKLGTVRVGGSNPVRIMGILNTSPESFYKKSVSIGKQKIVDAGYQRAKKILKENLELKKKLENKI